MDKLTQCYTIIAPILKEYAALPYSCQNLQHKLVISDDKKDYLLMTIGWENDVKIHGYLVQIEIINDKIWIHRDGLEYGIANNEIVLAFHPLEVRQFTEFSVSEYSHTVHTVESKC